MSNSAVLARSCQKAQQTVTEFHSGLKNPGLRGGREGQGGAQRNFWAMDNFFFNGTGH